MPSLYEELKKLSTQETNKKKWTKEVDTFTRRHKRLTGTCEEGESMSLTLNNANQNHNGISLSLPNPYPTPALVRMASIKKTKGRNTGKDVEEQELTVGRDMNQ